MFTTVYVDGSIYEMRIVGHLRVFSYSAKILSEASDYGVGKEDARSEFVQSPPRPDRLPSLKTVFVI